MDKFNKLSQKECGPGGLKCSCCGPAPGRERKRLRRLTRRRFNEETRKEIRDEDS